MGWSLMDGEKRCGSTRVHKPHLWSRTTRKTVIEETAGDSFRCSGSVQAETPIKKGEVSPARAAQIRADAHSGRNWAQEVGTPPACTCGSGQRLFDAANALRGVHGRPSGLCDRHPGGTSWAPPPGLWKKIKEGK
jgi:hypothetical protein